MRSAPLEPPDQDALSHNLSPVVFCELFLVQSSLPTTGFEVKLLIVRELSI